MFLTWLPDVLRDAGVDVYVMPGAETRSSWTTGLRTVHGVVWHHTATSTSWLDGHVAALLRDGRRDLSGPLSQVGIERDGTWVIVALGRANHNGYGTYVPGAEWGNDSIGLEFYNSGLGEAFTEEQYQSGLIGTAAILRHLDLDVDKVLGHKETDPRRKIDPTLDMPSVRWDLISHVYPPAPLPPAAPKVEAMEILHIKDTTKYFAVMPDGLVRLTPAEVYVAAVENPDTVKVTHLSDPLVTKLHSGPRAVSFVNAPVMEPGKVA